MSLPYQPKFLYRRRVGAPIPGFAGPDYTLGSLSNRPGYDWATPRYVRDEPDMYMAGFGDETFLTEDEINADMAQSTPPTMDSGPILTDEEIAADRAKDTETSIWQDLQSYGSSAVDFAKQHQSEISALVKMGFSAAEAYNKLAGGGSVPSYIPPSYAPPPTPTAPIPATTTMKPVYVATGLVPNAKSIVEAMLIKRGDLKPASSNTTMLLVVGAVAVGAFLLLRK